MQNNSDRVSDDPNNQETNIDQDKNQGEDTQQQTGIDVPQQFPNIRPDTTIQAPQEDRQQEGDEDEVDKKTGPAIEESDFDPKKGTGSQNEGTSGF